MTYRQLIDHRMLTSYHECMESFRTLCADGLCLRGLNVSTPNSDVDLGIRLCRNVAEAIIAAGGAALLELEPCPWDALCVVGPESADPEITRVRDDLGIVDYFEEGPDAE